MKKIEEEKLNKLFYFYLEKIEIHNINNNSDYLKENLRFHKIKIKNFIKENVVEIYETPYIMHLIYKKVINNTEKFYIELYTGTIEFDSYLEVIEKAFLIDIFNQHPLYSAIEGISEYIVEELEKEYDNKVLKEKIEDF